jgi:hypothetical protein
MSTRAASAAVEGYFRPLFAAGAALLLVALVLALGRFPGFGLVVSSLGGLLGGDGVVSAQDRVFLAGFLLTATTLSAVSGLLLLAFSIPRYRRFLAAIIGWDALAVFELRVPNPYLVLAGSSALGLGLIALWLIAERIGGPMAGLLSKEGPLETLSFLLNLTAAGLCAVAAMRWKVWTPKSLRAVPLLYGLCAAGLFLVAMEEIKWGQLVFGFETPASWAALNHQGEMSLHNLLDRTALTFTWQAASITFGVATFLSMALSVLHPRSLAGAIAPHPSLALLALMGSYAGTRLHPELAELLLSIFFACYAYRICVAARSSALVWSADPATASRDIARDAAIGRLQPASTAWRMVRYTITIGVIAVLLYRVDWMQAQEEIAQIPLWWLVGVFIAMFVALVVTTWRWSYALEMHNLHYPFLMLVRTLLSGFFLNTFLPTAIGGDAYRAYRTMPRANYRSRALSAIVLDRMAGFLVLLAFGAVAALTLMDRFAIARIYCLVLAVVAAVGAVGFVALERGWLHNVTARWDGFKPLNAIRHSLALLNNRGRYWLLLFVSSAAFQALSIATVLAMFAAVSAEATFAQCALIMAAVSIVGVLPISINGIGIIEGAFVAAAVTLGIDYDKALVVAFLRRLLMLCLAVVCGAIYMTEPAKPKDA